MGMSEEDARARRLTGFKRSPNIIRIDIQTRFGRFFCISIETVKADRRGIRFADEDGMRIWPTFEQKREGRSSLDMDRETWCDQGICSMIQATRYAFVRMSILDCDR
jgi:hypothetical protein